MYRADPFSELGPQFSVWHFHQIFRKRANDFGLGRRIQHSLDFSKNVGRCDYRQLIEGTARGFGIQLPRDRVGKILFRENVRVVAGLHSVMG